MHVSKEILSTWVALRGDKAQIQKDTGLSQPTIIKAFKGEASQKTIILISGYFQKRVEAMEKLKDLSI